MDEFMNSLGKGAKFAQDPMAALAPQAMQVAAPAIQAVAPSLAAPAAAAAGGGAAPGMLAAAGGPIGLAAAGIGALLGGALNAAKKKKEAEVATLEAQAEGAGKLGAVQSGGLNALMNAYRGMQ